jgi:hypothetical protein
MKIDLYQRLSWCDNLLTGTFVLEFQILYVQEYMKQLNEKKEDFDLID